MALPRSGLRKAGEASGEALVTGRRKGSNLEQATDNHWCGAWPEVHLWEGREGCWKSPLGSAPRLAGPTNWGLFREALEAQ